MKKDKFQNFRAVKSSALPLRALIKNSKVILADEPTGNLDSTTSHEIFELLKALSKTKLIVVVTHDKEMRVHTVTGLLKLKMAKSLQTAPLA